MSCLTLQIKEKPDLSLEAAMKIDSLDHLVLTVKDIDASRAFYGRVLGMV